MQASLHQHGQRQRSQGMTLVEVAALLVTLFLLAAFILPALRPPKTRSPRIKCVSNLKHASLGFRLWAADHGDMYPWQVSTNQGGAKEYALATDMVRVFAVVTNEMMTPKILKCPSNTNRPVTVTKFDKLTRQSVSYYLNLSAVDQRPMDAVIGDRNILIDGVRAPAGLMTVRSNQSLLWDQDIHRGRGNVGLVDGSVQQLSVAALPDDYWRAAAYGTISTSTNLLVFP
jgi:prepilin-type processing-associated H-X9-DG protein